ncbi:MAG: hypothetical protein V4667_05670 [Bacteroidota bacterium]
MNKTLIFLIISFTFYSIIYAQKNHGKFIIKGSVVAKNCEIKDSKVDFLLYKNGNLEKRIKKSSNKKIKFILDYQNEYILKIEKNGYISKSIIFDTNIDENKIREGFEPYPFKIFLCKQTIDSIKEYPKPVVLIRFLEDKDVFDFDNLYYLNRQKEFEEIKCD